MGHDASKVLFGSSGSSAKEISSFGVDPASFPAGRAVSLASSGLPSLLASAGMRMGVTLGKSLSNHKKSAVARTGESIPIRLALKKAVASVVITDYAALVSGTADVVTVNGTAFTAQAGAATPGDATFQAATSNDATAASLAAQINAHAVVGAIIRVSASAATVSLVAVGEGATGDAYTLTYTDNDTNIGATVSGATFTDGSIDPDDIAYVTKGAKVYIDNYSGMATANQAGATISDAVYVSGVLTGINEDGSESPAALIDMPGGL